MVAFVISFIAVLFIVFGVMVKIGEQVEASPEGKDWLDSYLCQQAGHECEEQK